VHTAKCAKLIETVSVTVSTGLIVGRVILHTQTPDWLVNTSMMIELHQEVESAVLFILFGKINLQSFWVALI
jgi:hypothetical protein